jgi:membrane protein CcdC involved in cytochrome C biogenesis
VNFHDLYLQYARFLTPVLRIGPIVGGLGLLLWRVQETRMPVSIKSIVIPPLGMSTGFCMFFAPATRVPWSWAAVSLAFGLFVLSWPLISSSKLEPRDGVIYMKRSRAFLWIIFGLFSIRILLHDYIGQFITPLQTAAVFYLMAFGMIVRWRATLYVAYRRLIRDGAIGQ